MKGMRPAFLLGLILTPFLAAQSRVAPGSPNTMLHGFRPTTTYRNDSDRPMGGRYVHDKTGFVLDLIEIQSVPQGFLYVNTPPVSDRGEPHTQEHLLLGKGNVGRAVSGLETMQLSGSTAFTSQRRTVYQFFTPNEEIFFPQTEQRIHALLHPDYTDEEIRREVMHLGVVELPGGKGLRLEEKGTIYQEMVSSYTQPNRILFDQMMRIVYGPRHPLALSSGGRPDAIRSMKPSDIRSFHASTYHLANMGLILSVPPSMKRDDVLARFDAMLVRLQGNAPRRKSFASGDLPAPQPGPAGSVTITGFPARSEQQPGFAYFLWPANRELSLAERSLLELFVSNLASDATSNLYKIFVDSKTKKMDIGARGVTGYVSDDLGHPVMIGISQIAPVHLSEEKLKQVRGLIEEELSRIASWQPGSPELEEFNARLRNRILETKRQLAKFVNSPPGFGFRGTSAAWMDHLEALNEEASGQKSLTLKPTVEALERELAKPGNLWAEKLRAWKLTGVTPYTGAAKPAPSMMQREEQEKTARLAAELKRLEAKYGADPLAAFKKDYDAETARLDEAAKGGSLAKFTDRPPLTLDDQLDWKQTTLRQKVPLVSSTFESMTSATAGIALRLESVPSEDLFLLAALPALLTGSGVVENGKAIAFEEMRERLRREILSLNANYSTNLLTRRAELIVRGSGNDVAESQRALAWMGLILKSPNWRPENLARIRDLVDQALAAARTTTQRSEEAWVNNPAAAWYRQDDPVLLSTSSTFTQAHDLLRLRWLLKDPGPHGTALAGFFAELGAMRGTRAERVAALKNIAAASALPPDAQPIAAEAAKDLEQLLNDLPDASLAADWSYLCVRMKKDLMVPPPATLDRLNRLRQSLLRLPAARMFVVGSSATQVQLAAPLDSLLDGFSPEGLPAVSRSRTRTIEARVKQRDPQAAARFVAYLAPSMNGGVFINSAPFLTYDQYNRETQLDHLAANLLSGGGSHGLFMRTWGAGLAYSNGIGGGPGNGRLRYYAERTPELPLTLQFVINEVRNAKPDPALAEYALAQSFGGFRSPQGYEARAEAMAADLADGITPPKVRKFREDLLALRNTPDLAQELFRRMPSVYATVLPGLHGKDGLAPNGNYFVIGPEKQLAAYETYLKSTVDPESTLCRLYGRDFWRVED
jgi:Zn-dependent M16 (insulinase) family peptidase